MSFVGTRPEVTKYVKKYTKEMRATLLLPAGITSEARCTDKYAVTQVLNVMAICFVLMLLMQFAVVSYSAIEQGLIILFMSKALEFNKK